MKKKLVDKISDSWEIPREILSNVQKIVITGNGMIHIEGFSGIAELGDERITIKVKNGSVKIFGTELCAASLIKIVETIRRKEHCSCAGKCFRRVWY